MQSDAGTASLHLRATPAVAFWRHSPAAAAAAAPSASAASL